KMPEGEWFFPQGCAVASVGYSDQMRSISSRVREARNRKGLTQQQVADGIGLSKQFVSHLEKGRCSLSVATALRLCRALGVDVRWLLTGDGQEELVQGVEEVKGGAPTASPAELLAIAQGTVDPQKIEGRLEVITPCSPRALAFSAWDRALAPSVDVGQILVVDPVIKPSPGDIVLVALLESNEVLLRRFKPESENRVAPPYILK